MDDPDGLVSGSVLDKKCVLSSRLYSMETFTNILSDRGSKYAVSGVKVSSRLEAVAAVKTLKKDKKFAKATHNTWAVVLSEGGPVKNDDGEGGAGRIILQMLEGAGLTDHMIIVTRWYGGVKLGGDRFRRVQDSVRYYFGHKS
ncbi:MAG: YigZ family protein [Sneathiella sp.]